MDAKKREEPIAEVLTRKTERVEGTQTYFVYHKNSTKIFSTVDLNGPDPHSGGAAGASALIAHQIAHIKYASHRYSAR